MVMIGNDITKSSFQPLYKHNNYCKPASIDAHTSVLLEGFGSDERHGSLDGGLRPGDPGDVEIWEEESKLSGRGLL